MKNHLNDYDDDDDEINYYYDDGDEDDLRCHWYFLNYHDECNCVLDKLFHQSRNRRVVSLP